MRSVYNQPSHLKGITDPLSHLILAGDCLLPFVGALVDYPHKVMEIALVHLLTVLLTH